MSPRTYRISEFAALAGVTVRTLHHYDRVGLLRPMRTANGYRRYSDAHLITLEQITALQFIGLSLSNVRRILKSVPSRSASSAD